MQLHQDLCFEGISIGTAKWNGMTWYRASDILVNCIGYDRCDRCTVYRQLIKDPEFVKYAAPAENRVQLVPYITLECIKACVRNSRKKKSAGPLLAYLQSRVEKEASILKLI